MFKLAPIGKLTRLPKLFKQIQYFLWAHKLIIVLAISGTIFLGSSLGLRAELIHNMQKGLSQVQSITPPNFSDISVLSAPASDSATPSPSVLGVSVDNSTNSIDNSNYTFSPLPLLSPLPFVSVTPLPSYSPTPTTISSTGGCSGTPNKVNSQVYDNSSGNPISVGANNPVTIKVVLMDCNNDSVSSDNLQIQFDQGVTSIINGSSEDPGYSFSAQAQNGQYSFQVNTSTPTTDKFIITDKNNNFQVTMYNYVEPQVTFTSGGGNSYNPNCTSAEDDNNSNVYITPSSPTAGSDASVSVSLKDCNGLAIIGDTLTVIPGSNNDNSFQFIYPGGSGSGSFTIPNNGTSFQIYASVAGNDTFSIEDTSHTPNFYVNVPGSTAQVISVTFVGGTSSNNSSNSGSNNSSNSSTSTASPSASTSTATSSANQ